MESWLGPLVALDHALFRLINHHSRNPLYDDLLTWLTGGGTVQWICILTAVVVLVRGYRQGGRRAVIDAWTIVLVGGLAVALCETASGSYLKPWLARPRPPVALGADDVRLLVGLGGSYSLPSAHAHHTAAVMTAVARGWPEAAPYALGYAAAIAYSRVYVGVHFPFDAAVGALMGSGVALGLWWLAERIGKP